MGKSLCAALHCAGAARGQDDAWCARLESLARQQIETLRRLPSESDKDARARARQLGERCEREAGDRRRVEAELLELAAGRAGLEEHVRRLEADLRAALAPSHADPAAGRAPLPVSPPPASTHGLPDARAAALADGPGAALRGVAADRGPGAEALGEVEAAPAGGGEAGGRGGQERRARPDEAVGPKPARSRGLGPGPGDNAGPPTPRVRPGNATHGSATVASAAAAAAVSTAGAGQGGGPFRRLTMAVATQTDQDSDSAVAAAATPGASLAGPASPAHAVAAVDTAAADAQRASERAAKRAARQQLRLEEATAEELVRVREAARKLDGYLRFYVPVLRVQVPPRPPFVPRASCRHPPGHPVGCCMIGARAGLRSGRDGAWPASGGGVHWSMRGHEGT